MIVIWEGRASELRWKPWLRAHEEDIGKAHLQAKDRWSSGVGKHPYAFSITGSWPVCWSDCF